MKRINLFILLIIFSFLSVHAHPDVVRGDTLAKDSVAMLPWPLFMTNRLDSAIQQNPVMKYATLGMQVYDLTADSIIFRHNDQQKMVPASNEKLITSVTAIERLGKDFPFSTRLYHTGEISTDSLVFTDTLLVDSSLVLQPRVVPRRVLHGDLYAVGSFDPAFDGYDFNQFVSRLADLQIDSIDGMLYEDVSLKNTIQRNKTMLWTQHEDNPDLPSLMINKKGGFMLKFKDELQRRRIPVRDGGVGFAMCPDTAKLVHEKIRTLNQLMPRLMKNSDNVYAEAIFYQLAAFSYRKFLSAEDPENAINQQIRKLGYSNPSDFTILDGSGLSHFNYLTPDMLISLLKYVRENEQIYEVFYPSLPIAGVDGTIETRMKNGPAYQNVRAKTGTLNGVITLSGYCTAANGHELLFSILLNDTRSSLHARNFQDDLCTILTHDESFMKVKKPVVRRRTTKKRTKK
ncbi:MAG: D-alanyl-D-alanine carboxypeptidase/D-alanyl-D-alanine-endopeptidase [Bacteroidaceae bacterium]|nr:D-alanyl-D-alanine carboxypeptidase/D-alanyl-D-alanine-endopeptidase [Bacteroidaceae bacterium]